MPSGGAASDDGNPMRTVKEPREFDPRNIGFEDFMVPAKGEILPGAPHTSE